MAIEALEYQIVEPQRGDWETASDISHQIGLHKEVMVKRSPEEVEQYFGGRSIIVRAIDPKDGMWKNAAFVALTHEYIEDDKLSAEVGAVVANPEFNGYRRDLAALAILKLLDLDIVGKYDELFALVAATNYRSIALFDGLQNVQRIDARVLPAAAFGEVINGEVDGPEKYQGFLLRRSTRQSILNADQNQTVI